MIQQAARSNIAKSTEWVTLSTNIATIRTLSTREILPLAIVLIKAGGSDRRTKREMGEINGEVLRESGIRNDRLDRRVELAALKGSPIDFPEEAVLLDCLQILLHVVSETLGGFLAEKTGEEILCVGSEEIGEHELLLDDLLLELCVVVSAEWG